MSDDIVERVARAICEARGISPDTLHQHHKWEDYPADRTYTYNALGDGEKTILMHYAWRKRVKEAEAAISAMQGTRADEATITAIRAEVEQLRGRQCIPIIDQNKQKVGVSYHSYDELHRIEAFLDDDGTTWLPPTAWAYRQACKALEAKRAEVAGLMEALERVLPFTEAERLAEASKVRLGTIDRDPVNKAILKAREALAKPNLK